MSNIFTELYEVFINHTVESFILLALVIFIWKFYFANDWFARENKRNFIHWFTRDIPLEIEYFLIKCVHNRYSYAGLNDERFDEVLELIRVLPGMDGWKLYDFLSAKLRISSDSVWLIMKALRDLKLIEYSKDHYVVNEEKVRLYE